MPEASRAESMDAHLRSIEALGAGYWWHDHRHEVVRSMLPTAPKRLLDFGCGTGGFLRWLMGRVGEGTALYGYDVSAEAGALTAATHGRVSTLPSWPARDLSFDAVVAMDVIEHVEDDVGCLRTLAQSLSSDGKLIITVPAHQIFWSSWDVRLGHFRRYNAATLHNALAKAGLTVERMTHVFAFLVGPALVRRMMPDKPANAAAEFKPLPLPVNAVLRGLCASERGLLAHANLPFGTSLLAVAKRAKGA